MIKKLTGSAGILPEIQENLNKLHLEAKSQSLTPRARKVLETHIRKVISDLGGLLNDLDPIRQPTSLFDPSNPKVVGRFVSLALVAQSRLPMINISRFYGSGVYAIYYNGNFPPYQPIANSETPIYVGQAAPSISNARTPSEQGEKLSSRLIEHFKNISKATTSLSINDFEYRALVVQSGWETAAEDYLIHLFHPIWNSETQLVYGLGKHGDAAVTRSNKRSPWDTIHPGRIWASDIKLQDAKTPARVEQELEQHFKIHAAFPDLDSLLLSFLDELKQI
ncbi:Eco29kI family restriction endonuclease [Mucilaginibacter gilvus]|uniref:Eco29kI family restriction endonuclease n=1 Tax=Mucilaginibacter gilvus TaxID=2305909 RepID=A0A3S3UJ21_9SPHI|nr:Eco29kI family restriction endonuclease [Mucilaginibacter gilvus]RWY47479.1 Eco29kI family restriction endonuclease [Mucilaginibacter gilvus]